MVTVRWLYIKQRRDRKYGRIPCNLHLETEKTWLRRLQSVEIRGQSSPGRGAEGARALRRDCLWSKNTREGRVAGLESAQGRAVGHKAGGEGGGADW